MSRASEWAKARPAPFTMGEPFDSRVLAMVDESSGGMIINDIPPDCTVPPDEAIKLAHWILDTFGESAAGRREA